MFFSHATRRAVARRPMLEVLEDRLAPAVLTVNSVDNADARDGVLTLREAIRLASGGLTVAALSDAERFQVSGALAAAPERDVIRFEIGSGTQTIMVEGTDLPEIGQPVEIDGTPPPDRPDRPDLSGQLIEISGEKFVTGTHTGLRLRGGNSILRRLTINRFNGNQVHLTAAGNNLLVGNYLGVDVAGGAVAQSGTTATGLYLDNTPDNTIGGTDPADRNVISGNSKGIYIQGAGSPAVNAARNNRIVGNHIGTDLAGNADLGNAIGVFVQIGHHNTIGGTTPQERNVISGNNSGIRVESISAAPQLGSDNVIQGNYLGTNAAATAAVANTYGVYLGLGSRQLVGGITPGAGNLIVGSSIGVWLNSAKDSRIQGNRIGTGPLGTEDWGGINGVLFGNSPTDNLIGGRDEDDGAADGVVAAGNVIAFSTSHGVMAQNAAATYRNAILGNSIYSNDQLGINLQGVGDATTGVTPNDELTIPFDADIGANGRQNFPVLTRAGNSPFGLAFEGTLRSAANTTYRVEFFSNPAPELPSHHGEGRTYLGAVNVTTDATGLADFTGGNALTLLGGLSGEHYLTATASPLAWDHDGNPATALYPTSTSEFSAEFYLDAGINIAPVATDGNFSTTSGPLFGGPITIDLRTLVSDAETADDDLTYEIVRQPNDVARLPQGEFLQLIVPPGGFVGNISFTYKVTDRGNPAQPSDVKTVTIRVDALRPDLCVTLIPAGAAVEGEDLVYTLRVENHGPGEAAGVQVDFSLPASVVRTPRGFTVVPQAELVNVIPDAAHGGTYFTQPAPGGISLRFTLAQPLRPFAEGDSATFTVVVRPVVSERTITAHSSAVSALPDLNPADNAAVATTFIGSRQSDLSVRIDAPMRVTVLNALEYQIVVTNAGPQAAQGVRVLSVLPYFEARGVRRGYLREIVLDSTAASFNERTQSVTWDVGTLASGGTATLTVRGVVNASAGGKTLTNRTGVTPTVGDPNLGNNVAIKVTEAVPEPDLAVTMKRVRFPGNVVNVNSPVDYEITVRNNGTGTATAVTVTVQLPLGVTFLRAPGGPNNVGPIPGVLITPSNQTQFLSARDLVQGASKTFFLRFIPRSAGLLATGVSVAGNEPDPDLANNSVVQTVTAGPAIELVEDGSFDYRTVGLRSPWTLTGAADDRGKLTLRPNRGGRAIAEQFVTIPPTTGLVTLTFNLTVSARDGRNQLQVELLGGPTPPIVLRDDVANGTYTFALLTRPGEVMGLRFTAITSRAGDARLTTWSIDEVSLVTL